MTPPPLFRLADTPLDLGTTLIEASAGTGKTFTLAGLFLRLLVETDLSHREILIVTFTEAATGELRDRIRRRLAEAVAAFTAGHSDDGLLAALLLRVQGPKSNARSQSSAPDPDPVISDRADTCAKLERALSSFDEAPIYTLHGFCQRVLRDRAFESGGLFDVELVADNRPLLDEVVADWWRTTFAETSALARAGFAGAAGLTRDGLRRLLAEAVRHPGLRLLASATAEDLPGLLARLDATFAEAVRLWLRDGPELRRHFGDGPEAAWAKRPYNSAEEMALKLASLDACATGTAGADDFKAFALFTPDALREGTRAKGGHQPPQHPSFNLCGELTALQADLLAAWQLAFHAWALPELARRKAERKVQGFDDLLTRLDAALAAPGGDQLACGVAAQYRAALIDEFQDTDPVQWRVLHRLFGGHDQRLALIGDPKQAIYGFRGADVFTYLAAAHGAGHRHTLGTNWRSESGLVAGVNALFSAHPRAFVVRDIAFHPAVPGPDADQAPLTEDGRRLAPLQLWFWPDEEPLAKSSAERPLAEMVATEVVRLLRAPDVRIGPRPVRPRDLAVLVETHAQADLIAVALRARGVPSAQQAKGSVFATAEADEFAVLLEALAAPTDERRLRAALTTTLAGLDAPELDRLAGDENAWAAWLGRFQHWAGRWRDAGFYPMFRELAQGLHIRARLLALPDGERRLTNMLHLAELLHATAAERRLGVSGLVQWFTARRARTEDSPDEEQLRLERDDDAVQLVTIHRSKGLEYPVVFVPFSFKTAKPSRQRERDEEILCHDGPGGALLRDLGSSAEAEHRRRSRQEKLAENVRLLYVALTRARNRCYFVWGDLKNLATTAPAWLLHGPHEFADADDAVEMLDAALDLKDDQSAGVKRGAAEQVVATAASRTPLPPIALGPPPTPAAIRWDPETPDTTPLAARTFSRVLDPAWRVASFSWLAAGQRDEAPDRDQLETSSAPVGGTAPAHTGATDPHVLPAPGHIHAFPRGTEAGTCLHSIFERLDFTTALTDEAALGKVIAGALREHAIDGQTFAPAVTDMVRRTLSVPLSSAQRASPPLTLSQIPARARLIELEFCFPLRRFTPDDLRRVLLRHGADLPAGFPHALERLLFNPVEGVLRGFMDLVFRHDGRWWLVDWKSNWLGPRAEDYTPASIAAAMAGHLYPLQYLLYTLALDRWLTLRVPGHDYARDFGGVRYLFLRGLDPARPELGVFADKPSAELVRELGELLLAPPEGEAG